MCAQVSVQLVVGAGAGPKKNATARTNPHQFYRSRREAGGSEVKPRPITAYPKP